MKLTDDPISPGHYRGHPSGIECIEVTERMNFNLGNAFKYLFRCGHKGDPVQDLRKAYWYLDRELCRRACRPWWYRLWAEDEVYDSGIEGSADIQTILTFEHRYSGHMRSAMERIYAAHILGRSTKTLESAMSSVSSMIKIASNRYP
jgi:hypothetical protein